MKFRKGFSLLELIVVLTVIGIIGTFGYKKYAEVMEESKATQYADALKKAEAAYSKVVGYAGTIRPAPVDPTGDYTNDDSLRCFDYTTDNFDGKYQSINTGTTEDMDQYGIDFLNSYYDSLKGMGFKEKTNGGLYVQSAPRSKFYTCYKNGYRFFAISGIKGSVALKLLKQINNGLAPSADDGKSHEKRLAIWQARATGIYDHVTSTSTESTTTEASSESSGNTTPYTLVEKIESAPNLIITFSLTKGTKTSTEW